MGDFECFIVLNPGSYKSDEPTNNTGSNKNHLNCDFIICSVVNGIREPFLYSFALSSPTVSKNV